ncbi:unnamed protein product [Cylicocyclus nassatus]|uniref:Uncharacterized protein n=1 Tax=Cylicocyclus nassatus TaxID=53992 RepID=A0AA36DPF5_CYLNA|nr:unnamed protein product [Cylicocyclus nassatus]
MSGDNSMIFIFFSPMHSSDVFQKGAIIAQLHHKSIQNRAMPVVVDFDKQIGEPQRVPGVGWAVPCDVVGLTSKKAKMVKVRFHPSVDGLSRLDQHVASAATRDGLKFLDALLDGSDWTRQEVKPVDPRIGYLERIAHFLHTREPTVSFNSRSLDLIWSLHPESHSNGKLDKFLADVRCSLHNHSIATAIIAKVQTESSKTGAIGQKVEVLFNKNELVWPLLRLSLPKDSDYLLAGTIEDCWQLNNDDCSLRISFPRVAAEIQEHLPVTLPREFHLAVIDRHEEIPVIMQSCQMRVDELRLRLEQSLASFQHSSQQRDKARSLRIVRQNDIEAIIEVNNPGERSRFDRLLATSPLNVICCNGGASAQAVASSPADSTDSGVAVSPLSSPFSSAKYSPFQQHLGANRQRSASDCGDWDGVVLKSILKKPHRNDRFLRSQSESQHSGCGDITSQLSLLMESTTEVDENEERADLDGEVVTEHRKKRVSFSEKVQERRFRVGQYGKKKGNELRARRVTMIVAVMMAALTTTKSPVYGLIVKIVDSLTAMMIVMALKKLHQYNLNKMFVKRIVGKIRLVNRERLPLIS